MRISTMMTVGSLLLAGVCAAAPARAEPACGRDCLSAALDAYLSGLYRHDPAQAGLAADYRATENAGQVPAGQGLWKTATGAGPVQRRYLDPQTRQAAWFGTLMEGAQTDIVSLRIKVEGSRVAEAEWTVARPGPGLFSVQGLIERPPPDVLLPPGERMTRAQLVSGADAYYQALQDHDGSGLPHEAGCERVENGVRVTNRTGPMPPPPGMPATMAPPPGMPGAGAEMRSGDCVAGFDRFAHSIKSTDLRRYPVADVEKGVVLGETLFHRPPGSPMKRNLLNEYFWLKDGKITGMYAAMYYLPATAKDTNGWN